MQLSEMFTSARELAFRTARMISILHWEKRGSTLHMELLEDLISKRINERPNHAVFVFPKPAALARRGIEEIGHSLPNFLDLFRPHHERFLVEDNLADASLGMEHTEKYWRYHPTTAEAYAALDGQMPGDFIVLSGSLGDDIAGENPFNARSMILADGGIPLDPFAVISVLFGINDLLAERCLWFDILGIEVSPKGDGRYDDTAYADRRGSSLVNLDWNWGKRKRSFRLAPYAFWPGRK